MEFTGRQAVPPNMKASLEVSEDSMPDPDLLDDAHEALSKLFNKTNKRAKHLRGVRRKDAWS